MTLRNRSSHKMSMKNLSWWRLSKTIVLTKITIHFKWICLPTREMILSPLESEREIKDTTIYQMKAKTSKSRPIKHLLKVAVLMTMIHTSLRQMLKTWIKLLLSIQALCKTKSSQSQAMSHLATRPIVSQLLLPQ